MEIINNCNTNSNTNSNSNTPFKCHKCGMVSDKNLSNTFSCSHAFCFRCMATRFFTNISEYVNKLQNKKSLTLKCFLCEDGHISCPLNTFLASLSNLKVDSSVNQLLNICKKHQLTYETYCLTCKKSLCSDCLKFHDELFTDHQRINEESNSNSKKYELCQVHNNIIGFYCITCGRTICKICIDMDHQVHYVMSLSEYMNKVKDGIKKLPIAFKTIDEFYIKLNEINTSAKSQFTEHYNQTLIEIDKLMASLRELRAQYEAQMAMAMNYHEMVGDVIKQTYAVFYSYFSIVYDEGKNSLVTSSQVACGSEQNSPGENAHLQDNIPKPAISSDSLSLNDILFINQISQEISEIKFSFNKSILSELEKMRMAIDHMWHDGKLLTTVHFDYIFRPVRDYRCIKTLSEHTDYLRAIVVIERKLISASDDKVIKIWDSDNDFKLLNTLKGHSDAVTCLLVLPDSVLASGSLDKTIRLWESKAEFKCIATIKGHNAGVNLLGIWTDKIFFSCALDKMIRLWDGKNEYKTSIYNLAGHSGTITSVLCVSNETILSGSTDKSLRVWDYKSGFKCLTVLTEHSAAISSLLQLSSGFVASASHDNTIRIWSLQEIKCEYILKGHTSRIEAIAELPDKRLASASSDRTIRIWDQDKSYSCTFVLSSHSWEIYSITILNGALASCSRDKTIKLWDPKDHFKNTHTLRGHIKDVTILLPLPDGRLVTGSHDFTIKIWKEDPNEAV